METEHNEHHHEPKKDNVIASSIIVGAILISASIFYNTKLALREFAAGGSVKGAGTAVAQAPTAPGQPTAGQPAQPAGPVNVAERKDAPVLGKSDAKVSFVEFTDFQCPYCQKFFNDAYKQIKEKYVDAGKVKIIFRHYPLPFHANAQKAGEAAECANRQGKFVQYHDVLFTKGQADGTGLDIASLKKYASETGLNLSKFNQCLDNGETAEIIKNDMAAGQAAGVSGTPTMFVNGIKVVGAQPFAVIQQTIDAALK